jgi:hypothetical protein
MPFDALVMRAVTAELAPVLVQSRLLAFVETPGAVFVTGRGAQGVWHVEIGIEPRLRHIMRVSAVPRRARAAAWAAPLVGGLVSEVRQPPWERVWNWTVRPDDAFQPSPLTLVVELAGHLTNVLWLQPDGTVGDARRRIAPDRPGRPIWPGVPYEPPPATGDPCTTGDLRQLPPWARERVLAGAVSLEELCRHYQVGTFRPYRYRRETDGTPDLWVLPGPSAEPVPGDWSAALRPVIREQERRLMLEELRRQAQAHVTRQLARITARLEDVAGFVNLDPEPWRRLGDSVLTHGAAGLAVTGRVPDLEHGGWLEVPDDWGALPYAEIAARAYHRYKKERARRDAARRLVPRLSSVRDALARDLATIRAAEDLDSLRAFVRSRGGADEGGSEHLPYRRFVSVGGLAIWVGRTEPENHTLTFRDARPDDLWFHVKQYPGPHVILRCGRTAPDREDLLDAATLAAFYSRARQGSAIPVDYTRRKFVRKRPHGAPGQVLYTQERTLYVTPDPERLERLGARRDRLAD